MEPKKSTKFNLPLFLTLSAVAFVCFLLLHFRTLYGWGMSILGSLEAVFVGIAIAYILLPLAKRLENLIQRKKKFRFARPFSAILTLILALSIVFLFMAMVLPQLIDTVASLVKELPGMIELSLAELQTHLPEDSELTASVMETIESIETTAVTWIKNNFLSTLTTVAGTVKNVGSAIISLVVSLVVAIYLLLDHERYLAQCKKLFLSVSKNEKFNLAVFDVLHQANHIFNGFISGKLVDSLIVGIICFIVMSLLKMPYSLLISVIVGVTNIIPMFGPIIGAVPGAFLLLMISPKQCVIFLIFIVILQQVDGNVIGPRILGNSTGVSALYVTVAILMFGKLWGFLGMLVGVPVFATLYYIVKKFAEQSLRKRGLPTETSEYQITSIGTNN